jgi:hypothetical protein
MKGERIEPAHGFCIDKSVLFRKFKTLVVGFLRVDAFAVKKAPRYCINAIFLPFTLQNRYLVQ